MTTFKNNRLRRYVFITTCTLLFFSLILTIAVMQYQQRIQNFAQTSFTDPPLFGCLHTGESDPTLCGTRLGKETKVILKLHGRPFNDKDNIVYYNDRLTGSVSYTNTGDLPLPIQNLGLIATSGLEPNRQALFQPGQSTFTLQPRDSTTVPNSSYQFKYTDPTGVWSVGTRLISNGKVVPIDEQKIPINLSSICTGLRAVEMSEKDRANAKSLCDKNPKSKLCSSRQYCEIVKDENCTQKNVSKRLDNAQCDQYIIVDEPEQEILEEFCAKYPNADTCKDFCLRSIGAETCPVFYLKDVPKSKFEDVKQATKSASINQAVAGVSDVAKEPVLIADGPLKSSEHSNVDALRGYGAKTPSPVRAAPKAAKRTLGTARVGAGAKAVAGRTGAAVRGALGGLIGGIAAPAPPPPPPPPPVTRENMPNYIVIGGQKRLCSLNACHNATRTACSPSNCVGGSSGTGLIGAGLGPAGALIAKNSLNSPPKIPPVTDRKLFYIPKEAGAQTACYTGKEGEICRPVPNPDKFTPAQVPAEAKNTYYIDKNGKRVDVDTFPLKSSGDTCSPSRSWECGSSVCKSNSWIGDKCQ